MRRNLLLIAVLLFTGSLDAQLYDDYLGNGHMQGITVQSSHHSSSSNQASNTVDGFQHSDELQLKDVSRFLAHTSFGGSYPEIQRVKSMGYQAYLTEQFEAKPNFLLPRARSFIAYYRELEREEDPGDGFGSFEARGVWWDLILKSNDQLRQRIAFALSEIFVTSARGSDVLEDSGIGMSAYYDMLIRNSFGNFKDLLLEISLHPVMGFYLSHYNNPKADSTANIFPDENYAREVMQLFSIGLYELNMDGSRRLDANGNPIPTYTNADIKELARVFTGLGAGAINPLFEEEFDEEPDEETTYFGMDWTGADPEVPMIMFDQFHDRGEKSCLNGLIIPADQSGMQDIEDAIDFLVNHPSCPPFICKLLIQRLVTSNPTPDYIARVASVFVDNGQGQRGDLKAVITAILMDDEARGCTDRTNNLNRAKLREPLIRKANYLRALEIRGNPSYYNGWLVGPGFRFEYSTSQMILFAPSVFNFFLPDYQPFGIISDLDLNAPEFQIHNSSTSIGYVNEVDYWTRYNSNFPFWDPLEFIVEGEEFPLYLPSDEDEEEGENFFLNREAFEQLATNPSALIDRVDLLFTHGQLSLESRTTILTAVTEVDDPSERVNMAIYLVMISPDYNILN